MDTYGIVIFLFGAFMYYATQKKPFFAFVAGVGGGIVIGAIWAVVLINNILGS